MDGKDLKLLGTKLSPFSHRIEWALKLKGIEYEFIVEDLKNKSSLLLDSNPVHKKVPVLIHGGKPISESLTILEYIDETWKHNPILPESPMERADMRFWAKFVDEKLYGASHKAFYSIGEDQAKALDSIAEGLQFLDGEINGKKFFGGEEIGFLDIVASVFAYWFKFAEEAAGIELVDSTKYPSFASWIDNFVQVPVIKDNLPPPGELRRVCHTLRMIWLAKLDEEIERQ
ncbi:probable glutathione S-transferase [Cornus florida]|uniref:probable glutathione S-transferase n=1 Tax=Cornus florida TaxID=4283 RepID=UPI0028A2BE7F|nr:probable glutathione S-transferase [Cornus florida]